VTPGIVTAPAEAALDAEADGALDSEADGASLAADADGASLDAAAVAGAAVGAAVDAGAAVGAALDAGAAVGAAVDAGAAVGVAAVEQPTTIAVTANAASTFRQRNCDREPVGGDMTAVPPLAPLAAHPACAATGLTWTPGAAPRFQYATMHAPVLRCQYRPMGSGHTVDHVTFA